MSLSFFLQNANFFVDALGGIVFFIVAWLALDSFLVRRDFVAVSRFIAFLLLGIAQIIQSLNPFDTIAMGSAILNAAGMLFLIANLYLEAPVARPEFKGILILPGTAAVATTNEFITALGFFIAGSLALKQYKKEFKKMLKSFWISCFCIALGAAISSTGNPDSANALWLAGHIIKFLGYFFLAIWVWQYLEERIREELLLVFIVFSLFISVVISLTFSSILIGRIEKNVEEGLVVNTRALAFILKDLSARAEAEAGHIATISSTGRALEKNDFEGLNRDLGKIKRERELGFLLITNKFGDVVIRGDDVTIAGETMAKTRNFMNAKDNRPFVAIEGKNYREGFSIRASHPLFGGKDGKMFLGMVMTGFSLDSTLADKIKSITGIDTSIFEGGVRTGTTVFAPDGRSRNVGTQETDSRVIVGVLGKGEPMVLRTTLFSRTVLSAYVPLKDRDGEIVGMIASSRPQKEILETAAATNRLTLVTTAIIMFILLLPIYLITKRLAAEV